TLLGIPFAAVVDQVPPGFILDESSLIHPGPGVVATTVSGSTITFFIPYLRSTEITYTIMPVLQGRVVAPRARMYPMFSPENDVLSNSNMLVVRAALQEADQPTIAPVYVIQQGQEPPEAPQPPVDLLVPDQGLDERRHKAGRTETIHVTLHNPGTSTWVVDLILRDVLIGAVWRGNVTLGPGETRQVQVPWTPEDGGRVLSVMADGQTVDLPYVYVERGAGTETLPQSSLWAGTPGVVLLVLAGLVIMVLSSMIFVRHRRNASRDRRMYEGR
ncbi:MAG: hypothetical protein KAQ96_10760, partial [Thermoplasmata archaeon]|nr:hypothetical protein [Thermoplasmata archaeon]